jgi:hypothetical protein
MPADAAKSGEQFRSEQSMFSRGIKGERERNLRGIYREPRHGEGARV